MSEIIRKKIEKAQKEKMCVILFMGKHLRVFLSMKSLVRVA